MASDPARIHPMAVEKARLCIRAAELRTKHVRFADIARELDLPSPVAAKKAVSVGLGLIPAENTVEVRREAADELHALAREAWAILENPGPLTTVSGKMVVNEATGEPYPDRQAQLAAIGKLLDISKQLRALYGADAPKQSVKFSGSLEDLRAEIERKRAELERAERGDDNDATAGVLTLPDKLR